MISEAATSEQSSADSGTLVGTGVTVGLGVAVGRGVAVGVGASVAVAVGGASVAVGAGVFRVVAVASGWAAQATALNESNDARMAAAKILNTQNPLAGVRTGPPPQRSCPKYEPSRGQKCPSPYARQVHTHAKKVPRSLWHPRLSPNPTKKSNPARNKKGGRTLKPAPTIAAIAAGAPRLPPFPDWDVLQIHLPRVLQQWADQDVVPVLLYALEGPARDAA